jgi:predicted RNA-binding protein YlqC (UPF0109 family)
MEIFGFNKDKDKDKDKEISNDQAGSTQSGEETIKELIEYLARALVDESDAVEVNVIEGKATTIVELRVAPDDIGKVVGKQGRTAKAMRTLLNAAATKLHKKAILEILE